MKHSAATVMKTGWKRFILYPRVLKKSGLLQLNEKSVFIFIPQLTKFPSVHHSIEPSLHYWLVWPIYSKSSTCPMPWKLIMEKSHGATDDVAKKRRQITKICLAPGALLSYPGSAVFLDPFFIDPSRINILKVDIWVGQKDLCCVWGIAQQCLTSRSF